jgi:hypothetical protein
MKKEYPFAKVCAGFLLLLVSYFVVSSWVYAEPKKSESRTLQVHVQVEPLFLVDVSSRAGTNTIEFGTVQLISREEMAKTETVQVDISVLSNLGVPYQVSHALTGPLVNQVGEVLALENFAVQTIPPAYGSGEVSTLQAIVPEGQLLFESSFDGVSDHFTANYLLSIPPTQAGGDYQTNLIYTIATKE